MLLRTPTVVRLESPLHGIFSFAIVPPSGREQGVKVAGVVIIWKIVDNHLLF